MLEIAHRVDAVAFDKTDTLTEGKPTVVALEPAVPVSRRTLFQLTTSVHAGSEHPLARAVVAVPVGNFIRLVTGSESGDALM